MGCHHKDHEEVPHGALTVGWDCAFRFGHGKNFVGSGNDALDDVHGQSRETPMHHEDAEIAVHIHK